MIEYYGVFDPCNWPHLVGLGQGLVVVVVDGYYDSGTQI